MLKVGLTGNIASGKSTVADVWRELGARVVDADELARAAVAPGSPALERIVARWGGAMLTPEGALEAIIHPRVAELRDAEFARAEAAGASLIVADIPLLYEVGLQSEFDLVVLVDAPAALRRDRIVRFRGLPPAEAERMIAAQMPSERKRPLADLVIDNTGSVADLQAAARGVWEEISRRAAVSA